jgi:hypothetical protein
MSKIELTEADRELAKADLIKEVKKNIAVGEIYEGYYQMKEGSKDKGADDLAYLGQIQGELKKSRALLEYILTFK